MPMSKPEPVPAVALMELIEDAARTVIEGGNWTMGDATDEACLAGLIAAHVADALLDRAMVICAPPLWCEPVA